MRYRTWWFRTESPTRHLPFSLAFPLYLDPMMNTPSLKANPQLCISSVTDAAVVETRLTAADGSTFDADVVFFDPSSRARVILEVSIVTIGSDTSLGRGARAGLDEVKAQLRAREEDKRNHSFVQRLLNEAGNNTIFTPIVMSACGAMGP